MTKTKERTLQTVAAEWLEKFETVTKGEGDQAYRIWVLKDHNKMKGPVYEMVRAAHGDMLPDDYKYEYIVDALERLAEGYDDEGDEIEADVYNSALLDWLGSHLERAGYVEDAVKEWGMDSKSFDLFTAIGFGQVFEKREVFFIVKAAIEKELEG